MRNTLALCGKEVRVLLTTWTSYVLFAAFLLISAFFFQRLVIEYQFRTLQFTQMHDEQTLQAMNLTDWVMAPLFLNVTVFFLFLLPILTMRLLAEERRQKTLELLMTTPVRPIEIVLGKYLAGVAIMGIMLGLTVIFPLLLDIFGASPQALHPVDWRSVSTTYLGMFLLGSAFVAVGLFSSSLSESQVVAVVLSFATLLMFYVVGLAARGQEGTWLSVLSYLSLNAHLEAFVRGLVRLTDVTYYLSIVFVSLFLTHQVVEAQRWR